MDWIDYTSILIVSLVVGFFLFRNNISWEKTRMRFIKFYHYKIGKKINSAKKFVFFILKRKFLEKRQANFTKRCQTMVKKDRKILAISKIKNA